MARLKEFQQQRRLLHCRLRKVVLRVLGRLRHERVWRVYREWYATRDTPTSARDGAEDPALATERMDDDRGGTHATADAGVGDSHALSPPSLRAQEQGSPSGSGLNPAAAEFVPQQQTMEAEQAPREPPHETASEAIKRVERRERQLAKELRQTRKAKRDATEAAEAATVAQRGAEATLRAARLRAAGATRPLGIREISSIARAAAQDARACSR